jgi:hypothetical protein
MLWILQNNLYKESKYAELVDFLERAGLPTIFVKALPFTDKLVAAEEDLSKARDQELIPDVVIPSGPCVTMGSYTLAKIAKSRGWTPGAWIDNLSYDVWGQMWPDDILNPKAKLCKFEDADMDDTKFIRPVEDSKSFSGKVFSPDEWRTWKKSVLEVATSEDPLNGSTEILISEPVDIWTENRIWVIDGKIVTHSLYKRGRTVHYSPNVDAEVLVFAEEMIKNWRPNDAFVLDVAQTPQGCKIVEVNCLNAAGFYAGDMSKIVMAIENKFG